jgi:hypothetical protein
LASESPGAEATWRQATTAVFTGRPFWRPTLAVRPMYAAAIPGIWGLILGPDLHDLGADHVEPGEGPERGEQFPAGQVD